jgi:phosphotriesterase-related protein
VDRGMKTGVKNAVLSLAAGLAVAAGWLGAVQAQSGAGVPNLAGQVLTVQGPIDPAMLGATLMHEHIFIDFKAPPPMRPPVTGLSVLKPAGTTPGTTPSGIAAGLTDYDESLAEVMEFKKAGGGSLVDVTNFGLTRDPEALLRIAKASALNVVMGSGWYQKALHPPDMADRTVDDLTAIVVRDVTVGAQGTTIRSGIVGEVGVNGKPLIDSELKSVRASARAARLTGAPMTIHSFGSNDEMLTVLDVIASEGVEMSRVVMGHMASREMPFLKQLFDRGVYVEFDYLGQAPLTPERNQQIVDKIAATIEAGYGDRLLVAHDICTKPQLKKNGGGGYAYISTTILPALKAKGVSDEKLRKLLIDNPRRVLTFVAPQAQVVQPAGK